MTALFSRVSNLRGAASVTKQVDPSNSDRVIIILRLFVLFNIYVSNDW